MLVAYRQYNFISKIRFKHEDTDQIKFQWSILESLAQLGKEKIIKERNEPK